MLTCYRLSRGYIELSPPCLPGAYFFGGIAMQGKVTKAAVDALIGNAIEERAVTILWDDALSGFGAKASPKGACSYVIQYRLGGRGAPTKRLTLGKHGPLTPQQARDLAKEMLGEVAKGIDVAEKKREARAKLAGATFAQAIEAFLKKRAKPTRYWNERRQRLLGSDLKELHGKPISTITQARIDAVLEKVRSRSAGAHRLLFSDLRPFFKWAKKHVPLEMNPIEDADKPAPVKKRERVLEDFEIKAFWEATGGMEWPFASIYRLLLLTGARREEVAAMRWDELDFEAGVWTLPAREDFVLKRLRRDNTEVHESRTKNAREHRIPLPSDALAILNRKEIDKIKAENGYPLDSEFVFSTTGTTPPSGFSKAKRALDLRMAKILGSRWDAKAEAFVGGRFKPWRVHDLRRTCATGMENLGAATRVVETALNHVSGVKSGIVGVYQLAEHRDAVQTAYQTWDNRVAELTGPDLPSNID